MSRLLASSRFPLFVGLSAAMLGGCATVPRGSAGSLADAGIAATNTLAADVRDTASQVRGVDALDTFSATYSMCSNPRIVCTAQLKSDANYRSREELAKAIELRAIAIDGLRKAYSALKTEASYDAKADLVGATNQAVEGVNNFATAIAAIGGATPAAALIGAPLQKIVGFGAGVLANGAQRKRLIRGSTAIEAATQRFRDALAVEAAVFANLADYIEKNRTAARLAFLDAGLGSYQDIVIKLGADLSIKPVGAVDAVLAQSPAAKAALRAIVQAQARAEVEKARVKYRIALDALDALINAHHELEADQPISLADVDRFLGELDSALAPATKEK